ncbi:hypothetical protein [Streptomyces kanamyceticus]|uniref:Uncharacterized protein n=1 Tax=Streptomyces kanamyceticus TaxID=1967 RepID=A0A5J6GK77_STRKN|nr:hypothetical protein [Streptomyces kanamyceticus]QEU93526.1 hypothetical protein CP970_23795 [Streptomyces kanamyceticus]
MTKTRSSAPHWVREDDEDWAATVEVRLVLDHDAPAGLADEVLAEAHEIVEQAGLPAREVLGDPGAYARTVAAERISEERRARVDVYGMTPGERVSAALCTLGFVGAALCLLYWIEDGLWIEVTLTSVVGCTTVALAVMLVAVALVARAAGRIRGMWGWLAGTAATVAGGAALTTAAPDARLLDVPAPVLALAAAAWTVGAFLFPDATIDRWFTPAPRPRDADDERWLARLDGLLRGRHAMKAAEARGHVREVRQHLTHTTDGERAEDVFGDVEVYALRLSEGPRAEQRLARRKLYGTAAMTVVFAILLVDRLLDPDERTSVWMLVWVAVFAYWVWSVFREWQALRKTGR